VARPVYSVRFALGKGGDHAFEVPSGKRAVVKCVSAYNTTASAGAVAIFIGALPVWQDAVQGNRPLAASGLMVVVNAGEVLQLSPTSGVVAQASGYLLDAP
jgi:hypothetical protein